MGILSRPHALGPIGRTTKVARIVVELRETEVVHIKFGRCCDATVVCDCCARRFVLDNRVLGQHAGRWRRISRHERLRREVRWAWLHWR
jgi:hypothetical protein